MSMTENRGLSRRATLQMLSLSGSLPLLNMPLPFHYGMRRNDGTGREVGRVYPAYTACSDYWAWPTLSSSVVNRSPMRGFQLPTRGPMA